MDKNYVGFIHPPENESVLKEMVCFTRTFLGVLYLVPMKSEPGGHRVSWCKCILNSAPKVALLGVPKACGCRLYFRVFLAICLLGRSGMFLFQVPWFVVSKKDSTKVPFITRLKKVNCQLRTSLFIIETWKTILAMLHPGQFACKVDLKDAYFHVP